MNQSQREHENQRSAWRSARTHIEINNELTAKILFCGEIHIGLCRLPYDLAGSQPQKQISFISATKLHVEIASKPRELSLVQTPDLTKKA
jgi:hypothetical protein